MKSAKPTIFIIVILTSFFCAKSQPGSNNSCGLYVSAADFSQHSLTYAFDCNSHQGKLHLNNFFGGRKGFVEQNGQKHEFVKQQVYGYRENNKDYRFYKNEAFRIIDTAGFFIYYQYEQEQPVKGKELVKTDEYYFSAGPGDKLQLLTIENLEKAFPHNAKFRYAVDENFKSDRDLIAYDHFANAYKIKYLFNESLK